jgi:hypothetical protein
MSQVFCVPLAQLVPRALSASVPRRQPAPIRADWPAAAANPCRTPPTPRPSPAKSPASGGCAPRPEPSHRRNCALSASESRRAARHCFHAVPARVPHHPPRAGPGLGRRRHRKKPAFHSVGSSPAPQTSSLFNPSRCSVSRIGRLNHVAFSSACFGSSSTP